MPNSIEHLKGLLADSLSRLTQGHFLPGKPDLMQEQVEKIRSQFNVLGGGMIQRDRICEAIRAFRRDGVKSLKKRQLRYLCRGLVMQCEDGAVAKLIEDGIFQTLLEWFNAGSQLSTLCWRGLLTGYFQYSSSESNPVGKSNWESLRVFLSQSFSGIYQSSRFKFPWMEVLNSNLNLLQEKPCQKYADAVLHGDNSETQRLKTELQIPVESWFWSELIRSQIDKIAGYNENDFKGHIDKIIPKLRDNKFYKDEGLKRLLSRYYRCANKEAHEGLKQFAVAPDIWGNPKLIKQGLWELVEPEVKQMVQGWFVLEDLRDFFDLLRADPTSVERRFDFWLKHIKQIQYSRIVLGDSAYRNQERDYRNLRDKKKGRLSRLLSSSRDDNAFIMKIGEYYFVEFTKTGNACYGYRENFQMEKPEYDSTVLKNWSAAVFREIHKDTSRLGNWEERFARKLAELGVYPDDQRQSPPRRTSEERQSSQDNSETELQAFLTRHQFRVQDNRRQGGALWVPHNVDTGDIAEQLRRFGFKYSPRKQGYWKK